MHAPLPPRGAPRIGARATMRTFASVEHLSVEAVAAFVDGELSPGATHRAKVHLVHCPECRADVAAQRRAADALRHSEDSSICAPSSLVARLTHIADHTPAPPSGQTENSSAQVAKIFSALRRAGRTRRR